MHLPIFQTLRTYLIVLVFLMIPNIARAVEISNIYQIDIPVKEQSDNARWEASLEGLRLVLVRRSGSQRILGSSETNNAYRKVTSYLQKFEYSRNDKVIDDYKFIISLYFDPRLIDDLIRQSNQPLWDFNRPVSILWLAHEETDQNSILVRRIITENDNEEIINEVITKNSNRRGVPVILPLMDLEDSLIVSQSDVWGRFPEAILDASKRYSVDSIIIGKIYQRDELWLGQFTYFNQTKNVSFEYQTDSIEAIYKQMFDGLAENLCKQYCVTQTESVGQKLFLEVQNVTNFETFQKIRRYLSDLSAIRQVDIININRDKLLLRLSLLSNEKAVVESLRLNRRLKLVEKQKDKFNELKVMDERSISIEDKPMDGSEQEQTRIYREESGIKDIEIGKDLVKGLKVKTIYYRWVD